MSEAVSPRASTSGSIRDASSVVLLRDGPDGPEVFLQRRVGAMAFAGGMTVFPGGGVDPTDESSAAGWVGPAARWWGDRFGVDEPRARSLVLAAVRETFEECGVLLAGTEASSIVTDTSVYAISRRQIESRVLSFGHFLVDNELSVRVDLLRPWANWITPRADPEATDSGSVPGRRYDTRFFVAQAPNGQSADDATSEAVDAGWATPAAALVDFASGARTLMPPTWSILRRLATFGSVEAILSAEADLRPVQPTLQAAGNTMRVRFDGADDYYADLPPQG